MTLNLYHNASEIALIYTDLKVQLGGVQIQLESTLTSLTGDNILTVKSVDGLNIGVIMKGELERMPREEFIRVCEITDPKMGECLYEVTEEDTLVVGAYIAELQTDFENGTRLSVANPILLSITKQNIGTRGDREYGRATKMF